MLEKTIRVCSYDVLPDGRIKPSAVQRYLQQLACDDISSCGASYSALRELSSVFVLMKLRIRFFKDVRNGDELLFRTYPYKTEGVMFFRALEVYSGDGLALDADTCWVLLNYRTRTIVRPSALPFDFPEEPLLREFAPLPRRISLTGEPDPVTTRKIYLTQTDENRHLNNSVYSDLILDDAPEDILAHPVRSFCILFEHEATAGETLELRYQRTPDGFLTEALHTDGANRGKTCFRSAFTLDFQAKM